MPGTTDMPTLAPKLPYTHPFAGGYPRLGGQPLPTDPDAIDYLERVKAADGGAAVEVGVAMAVDQFIKGCKSDSAGYAGDPTRTVWDALKASCILCGARTISGALVPLAGTAPTGYGDWASGDYDRSSGLKGNGSTKYLDSNRANDADGQDDNHNAVYVTNLPTAVGAYIGAGFADTGTNVIGDSSVTTYSVYIRSRNSSADSHGTTNTGGLLAASRSSASQYTGRISGTSQAFSRSSQSPHSANVYVFARNGSVQSRSNARLAFYSIGSSLDLALLDNRVSTLVAAIAAAL